MLLYKDVYIGSDVTPLKPKGDVTIKSGAVFKVEAKGKALSTMILRLDKVQELSLNESIKSWNMKNIFCYNGDCSCITSDCSG